MSNPTLGVLFCYNDSEKYITVMLNGNQAEVFGLTQQNSGEDTNAFMLRMMKNVYNDSSKMFKLQNADDAMKIVNGKTCTVKLTGNPSEVTYKKCDVIDFDLNKSVLMITENPCLITPENMAAAQRVINVPPRSCMSIKESALKESLKSGGNIYKDIVNNNKPLKLGNYQASDTLTKVLIKLVNPSEGTSLI